MEGLVGIGDTSMYNMTNTRILCTYTDFTYTNTTFGGTNPGALINFDFKAENTTWGLRKIMEKLYTVSSLRNDIEKTMTINPLKIVFTNQLENYPKRKIIIDKRRPD